METVFLLFQITNWSAVKAVQNGYWREAVVTGKFIHECLSERISGWDAISSVEVPSVKWGEIRKELRFDCSMIKRKTELSEQASWRIFFNKGLKIIYFTHSKVWVTCGSDTFNLPITRTSLGRSVNYIPKWLLRRVHCIFLKLNFIQLWQNMGRKNTNHVVCVIRNTCNKSLWSYFSYSQSPWFLFVSGSFWASISAVKSRKRNDWASRHDRWFV